MYLATIHHGASRTYQIRQSYLDEATESFQHRLIFDLGENPADHMELMGDAVVFFSRRLEQAVSASCPNDAAVQLERLLRPFLPRETRERFSRFDRSSRYVPGPLTAKDREKIAGQIHIFDRRRLYYLYYRAIDQAKLFRMRETVFRPLFDQSRDEREYYFTGMEKDLEPGEYRNYLYASFNLQRHFRLGYATYLPESLPQDEVAEHFLDDLCLLNSARDFWRVTPTPDSLHPHLVRYLLMFFDFIPRIRSYDEEFIRRFMNSHRTFRWPERQGAVSEEKIGEIFGQPLATLKKLNKRELNRLYRKKAFELHPDRGGDQDRFVELTEIYNTLLRKK